MNAVFEQNVRKGQLLGYPYGIYYRFENDLITVIAVAHLWRNPDWLKTKFG